MVSKPRGSKPSATDCILAKLFRTSPAALSRSRVSATATITSHSRLRRAVFVSELPKEPACKRGLNIGMRDLPGGPEREEKGREAGERRA